MKNKKKIICNLVKENTKGKKKKKNQDNMDSRKREREV